MTNETIELLILTLIGIAMVVFGNHKRTEYRKLTAFGIKTEVTIMGYDKFSDSDSMSSYPIFSYTTIKNENIVKQYNVGINPATNRIGGSVIIYYDATHSSTFIIDDKRSKFLGPVLMVTGLAMVIICVV